MAFPQRLESLLHRLVNALPPRMRLPFRAMVYRHSVHCEPEYRQLGQLHTGGALAVDIGANHGCYAYRMLRHFRQVYAFEPNVEGGYDLFHYKHPRLRVYPYALSDRSGEAPLHVPLQRSNGAALWGWASLEQREVEGASGARALTATLRTLDEVIGPARVDLIKIDVEGHELRTLRGAMGVIARDKPVLVIETAGDARTAVEAMLQPLGYEGAAKGGPNVVYRCP
jgi:FkbM family methyltransferase